MIISAMNINKTKVKLRFDQKIKAVIPLRNIHEIYKIERKITYINFCIFQVRSDSKYSRCLKVYLRIKKKERRMSNGRG